jgi:hypothetical protein
MIPKHRDVLLGFLCWNLDACTIPTIPGGDSIWGRNPAESPELES